MGGRIQSCALCTLSVYSVVLITHTLYTAHTLHALAHILLSCTFLNTQYFQQQLCTPNFIVVCKLDTFQQFVQTDCASQSQLSFNDDGHIYIYCVPPPIFILYCLDVSFNVLNESGCMLSLVFIPHVACCFPVVYPCSAPHWLIKFDRCERLIKGKIE